MKGWKYYNHALLPATAPHIPVDTSLIKNTGGWGLRVLFARWTSHYDCGHETDWWFCVKDKPFDISGLNANRRRKINLGNKNFEVCIINPNEYAEQLTNILMEANASYPIVNKKKYSKIELKNEFEYQTFDNRIFYGAFSKLTGNLCGYTVINNENDGCIGLETHKSIPEYERLNVNAALIYKVIMDYNFKLSKKYYINDGERNVLHTTGFQAYLEKYFGFRKAYCYLHLKYCLWLRLFVALLFPLRKFLFSFKKNRLIILFCAILRMEEISRNRIEKYGKKSE